MERHLRSTRPARPLSPAPAQAPVLADAAADTAMFAHAARQLAAEARRRGLVAPGFRSPPRLVGVDRSIRRHRGGAAVAVRVRSRPWVAVAADMIEGVIATNRLAPPASDRLRAELWAVLGFVPAAVAPTARARHAA